MGNQIQWIAVRREVCLFDVICAAVAVFSKIIMMRKDGLTALEYVPRLELI